jgi:hypothetical protein
MTNSVLQRGPGVDRPAHPDRTDESAVRRLAAALGDPEPETALEALPNPGTPTRTDRLHCLQLIYGLHLGRFGADGWLQHHPVVARWKWLLERQWLEELAAEDSAHRAGLPDEPVAAIRALAARDRLPRVYHWVAKQADLAGITRFAALEGGPDGGFDDMVAICQLGLPEAAKMELAKNYWDEMGNGDPLAVHGHLHAEFARALGVAQLEHESALARNTLLGLLATNRALQPELLGALGLIELQAGPRSRLVGQGLRRTGAPAASLPFYEVHAEVDPRHGKGWLEEAIQPIVADDPATGDRILRGAMWRSRANAELFEGPEILALMGAAPAAEDVPA